MTWLIVHNSSDPDSAAWATGYAAKRDIPEAHQLGLDLPGDELISEPQFLAVRSAIADHLDAGGLNDEVLGILLGHGVPGAYIRSDTGEAEAIAGQLHRIDGDTSPITNPLAPADDDAPLIRPAPDTLAGHRMTARIDGPTLADSEALTDRALAIESTGLPTDPADPGGDATIYLDPYASADPLFAPRTSQMEAWAAGLDRQRLRLPLAVSAEADPGGGGGPAAFDSIREDGFFWGWEQDAPPPGFFADPPGRRAFCAQIGFTTPTAPTLRDTAHPSWAIAALQHGYAAAAGSTRPHAASAVPLVRPFFEALRRGWTLGEAWLVACPVLRTGLMLIGDPLTRIGMPRAGWDVFGPFASWPRVRFDEPLAMLREPDRAYTIPEAARPAEGERAIYIVRHVDAEGRSEAGVAHAQARRVNDEPAAVVPPPAWPAVHGWSPRRSGDGWLIHAAWSERFANLGIDRVDLIEQAPGDPGAQLAVVMTHTPDPRERHVTFHHEPTAPVTRYRLRAIAPDGSGTDSPASAWLTHTAPEPHTLHPL